MRQRTSEQRPRKFGYGRVMDKRLRIIVGEGKIRVFRIGLTMMARSPWSDHVGKRLLGNCMSLASELSRQHCADHDSFLCYGLL